MTPVSEVVEAGPAPGPDLPSSIPQSSRRPAGALSDVFLALGISLQLGLVLTLAFTQTLFFGKTPISAAHAAFWGAAVAALLRWSLKSLGRYRRGLWLGLLAALAAVMLSGAFLCSRVYDFGPDSNTDHQQAIYNLLNGWNPVHDPAAFDFIESHPRYSLGPGFVEKGDHALYAAKASYIFAAILAKTIVWLDPPPSKAGRALEAAKVLNLYILLSVFFLVWAALGVFNLSWRKKLPLSMLSAVHPVALAQFFTAYQDQYLAQAFTSVTFAVAAFFTDAAARRRLWTLAYLAALALLLNGQQNGLPCAAAVLLCGGLFAFWSGSRRRWRFVQTGVAAFVFAAVFLGYNPYVTNLQSVGKAVHEATFIGPAPLDGMTRLEALTKSIFARGDQFNLKIKRPFRIDAEELESYQSPDLRLGGFGPLFATGLLAVLLAGATTPFRRLRTKSVCALPLAAGALSALFVPETYWARRVPQIGTMVIWAAVLLWALSEPRRHRARQVLAGAAVALLLLNSALIAWVGVRENIRKTANYKQRAMAFYTDRGARPLQMFFTNFDFDRIRLRDLGIPFTTVETRGQCPDPQPLWTADVLICG